MAVFPTAEMITLLAMFKFARHRKREMPLEPLRDAGKSYLQLHRCDFPRNSIRIQGNGIKT